MKKISLGMFVTVMILMFSTVHAQERQVPRPVLQNVRNNVEARKDLRASTTDAMKEAMSVRREEMKEMRVRLASTTREKMAQKYDVLRRVMINQVKRSIDRMQATIDRLTKISDKIYVRIEKIKSAGGQTSEAEKHVTEAKTHLSNAQSLVNSLKEASTTIAYVIDQGGLSTSTKRDKDKVKAVVSEIEKSLRSAHTSLVNAVRNLKGLSERPKATTTSSGAN